MQDLFSSLAQQFYISFIDQDRWQNYLEGLGVSFLVTIGALAIGLAIGILVAICRTMHDQTKGNCGKLLSFFNTVCRIYTTVIRGTPMMVQLLIMGFVIFVSSRNLIGIAILTLGINSGAYVSEIIRSGIMSIDPGQMEAGRSLGLPYGTVMRLIIIPQAIKNVFPALGNELITLFKDTSLVTVIGLTDLTKAAMQIQARTYQAFMPYLCIAAMYLICVLIMTKILGHFERRMRQSER